MAGYEALNASLWLVNAVAADSSAAFVASVLFWLYAFTAALYVVFNASLVLRSSASSFCSALYPAVASEVFSNASFRGAAANSAF